MFKIIPILILFFSSLALSNCKEKEGFIRNAQSVSVSQVGLSIRYDLDNPFKELLLARDLKEISGLAYSTDSRNLLSINDEKGYVYILDPSTAKILNRIDFGKKNDYEGIAYNNGSIYIVESNGDIIIVDEATKKRTNKYKTRLSRKNDIEGIVYNTMTSTFLVAAKGRGSIKEKTGKEKAIFSLDPKAESVSETPFIAIDLQQEIDRLNATNQSGGGLLTNYQKSRINKFSPSGIAVHPATNDIYVLSSRGKLLVIFDQKGALLGTHFLSEQLNSQPEGICFDSDLTMYISNEGRAGKGKILSFLYKK